MASGDVNSRSLSDRMTALLMYHSGLKKKIVLNQIFSLVLFASKDSLLSALENFLTVLCVCISFVHK